MRFVRGGLAVWAILVAWGWLFGVRGFVVGSLAFLGGWALGHRTGRHDAEHDQTVRMQRWIAQRRTWDMEGDRP